MLFYSLFIALGFIQTSLAQCPKYDLLMDLGNSFLKRGEPEEALIEFQAAQIAARECGLVADQPAAAIKKVFDELKAQRDNAIKAQKLAQTAQEELQAQIKRADFEAEESRSAKNEALLAKTIAEKARAESDSARAIAELEKEKTNAALQKADKLINAFYFYQNKFALAYKGNKFGFIDKKGDVIIPYKYDEALPFNEITGLALVRVNNIEYFIDTTGKEFQNIKNIDFINSNSKSIDLNGLGLKKLPDLSVCRDLQFLWLVGNRLNGSINQEIGARRIKKLDISANELSDIPHWVTSLEDLEYLNLRSNQIQNVAANNCFSLFELRVLNLSYNQIDYLPNSVANLRKLERLDLSNNLLRDIPSTICDLTELKVLQLNSNSISRLPDCIGKLTKLSQIEINSNKMESLPDSIGLLKDLEALDLSFNALKDLPGSFSNLKELRFLDLSYNQLFEIPSELRTLVNLQEINFAGNQIKELPIWLSELTSLQSIYFSGNPVKEIPSNIKHIVRID